ncbi:Neuromedin-K receptor like [Actinidia chinensis var. chinensis]|uniref:Neuromedin-K receptor like n=1 Tax=Actinidia chinensis var. chinensis TaxID=1590841 RepID=A0A2R6RF58_ACTCC|nr:Neuromedin-K receptor like [Actinidia chinensis var. chinensis]
MENNNSRLNPMKVSDMLKMAVRISHQNINFIIFILLTSLPLFCTMVLYELILQTTLVQASKILEPPHGYFYDSWPIPFYVGDLLSKDFCFELIQVSIVYLVPLHLLELFSAILTVDLASKMYTGETPMNLGEMVQRSLKEARFKGPLITSMLVHYLSTSITSGLIWLVIQYYFISRNIYHGYFFVIFFAAAFIGLLTKYLEWSALWNMSIVHSVLEEVCGIEAYSISDYFSRESNGNGLLLMLVFFLWGFVLRSLCLYFGCYKRVAGIIVPVCLLWMGNLIKWVTCLIYFYDCKERSLEIVEEKVKKAKAKATGGEELLKESNQSEEMNYEQKKPEAEPSDANNEQKKPEAEPLDV